MSSSKDHRKDETLRLVLDRALTDSAQDPLAVLAAVLGATGRDPNSEELNLQGQMAGDWRLVRVIGVGGMGVTYEAWDGNSNLAAVKVVGHVKAGSLARFEAECKAIQHLDHPGVVRYLSRGRLKSGKAFMVMEFVDGCDLAKLVHDIIEGAEGSVVDELRKRSDGVKKEVLREFCRLVRDVARALEAVHQEGIVHRDVKPGNIMIREDLTAVLIDFGLSRDAFRAENLTQTEAILGTLNFMAPEQAKSAHTADRRADIYSLGLVLAHCVGGPEFRDATREPCHPWKLPSFVTAASEGGIPAPIQAILYRAIQHQAEDRFRTAAELADDLDRFLNGWETRSKIPSFLSRISKHPRLRLALVVILTGIVATISTILLQNKPHYLTIDTINDGGRVTIDGKDYVAPVLDVELEPGEYELEYSAPFVRTIRRKIVIDRHYTRVNLYTFGRNGSVEEFDARNQPVGMLNINSGSKNDAVTIDGKQIDIKRRWYTLPVGWHTVESTGKAPDSAEPRTIKESMSVFVSENERTSILLLPDMMRNVVGSYRSTLGTMDVRSEPKTELDLGDGLIYWMNDFIDFVPNGDGYLHIRTCIAPTVTEKELTATLRHRFPEAMKSVFVYWGQVKTGSESSIKVEYRFGHGPWKQYVHDPATWDGLASEPGDIPERGVMSFEMRATLKAAQRPSGFSTVEMFWGYLDRHTVHHQNPAFAIVADPVSRQN